ncbi:MAG: acyl-CoA dehydrogenase family protein [Terriglobia bacterium]
MSSRNTVIKGGSFLIECRRPAEIFTPEDLTSQHQLIAQTAEEFVSKEVAPRLDDIEAKKPGLLRELISRAGELGLCATDVPQEYGGLALDRISSIIIAEKMARDGAWATTIGAQSGIGILPIAYFGSEAQKQRYVPGMARGETVGAYCLSEAGSGSDALHCKTRATLAPDSKHYLLNGVKMWTTNGGIADVYVVFAQADGSKFTAFIVERGFPGVSPGAEEHKMGIRGSSTTPLHLENARVPVENILGEIGKGHQIAFSILNVGRLRLGAGCIGGCKILMSPTLQWAKDRVAFGRPIASFGLIKEKLGEMVARIYAAESMSYRTGGLIDTRLAADASGPSQQTILAALQEYAVECSILKIAGTEALDYVSDEAMQIFGGYGYTTEYEIERVYRDQRVNRIFEGTNEINRLLIADMLLKRSMKGELALVAAAERLLDDVFTPVDSQKPEAGELVEEERIVQGAKRAALLVAGAALRRFMEALSEEQEVMGALSNLVIETYAMESALLRARKRLSVDSGEAAVFHRDAARCYIHEAAKRMEAEAHHALSHIAEGDTLRLQTTLLRRFLKRAPADVIQIRRRLADRALALGRYPFS